MSDIALRLNPALVKTSSENTPDRDRVLRELQTMNNLLAARTQHESARTEMLFNRWRRSGSPIERDIFPDDETTPPPILGDTA